MNQFEDIVNSGPVVVNGNTYTTIEEYIKDIVKENETNTTLSIAAGALVYNNEQANNANVRLISADTNNALIAGTDGALFAPVTTANNGLTKTGNNIQLGGDLEKNTLIDQKDFSLTIATGGEDLVISGLDKTKVQTTVNSGTGVTDHLLAVGSDNVVKALKAAMPKFFYMPSIIVPTSEDQLTATGSGQLAGDTFDDLTKQGTISLYGRYNAQFGSPMESNAAATTTLPVLPAAELDYHITWYDINVFSSVTVNNAGVMTYTVAPGADVTIGSFMNIVFAVREN